MRARQIKRVATPPIGPFASYQSQATIGSKNLHRQMMADRVHKLKGTAAGRKKLKKMNAAIGRVKAKESLEDWTFGEALLEVKAAKYRKAKRIAKLAALGTVAATGAALPWIALARRKKKTKESHTPETFGEALLEAKGDGLNLAKANRSRANMSGEYGTGKTKFKQYRDTLAKAKWGDRKRARATAANRAKGAAAADAAADKFSAFRKRTRRRAIGAGLGLSALGTAAYLGTRNRGKVKESEQVESFGEALQEIVGGAIGAATAGDGNRWRGFKRGMMGGAVGGVPGSFVGGLSARNDKTGKRNRKNYYRGKVGLPPRMPGKGGKYAGHKVS